MSECEKCHGTGRVTCSKCGGEKEVKCEKCNGKGTFRNCSKCDSTGKVDCPSCDGSGEEISICPVCNKGKIKKTRWINCDLCHGKGYYTGPGFEHHPKCVGCHGRGQVEDVYEDICPNCHGEYKRKTGKPCKKCGGTGKVGCPRCGGTGHAKCQDCSGSGKVKCDNCSGVGETRCPDCEKREREAKEKREREAREAKERREKKEAAEKAAKERRDAIQGCGCIIALVAIVGFLVWWWLEGFKAAALPGMWEQAKNFVGGSGGVAKIVGGLVVLFLGWKVMATIKRKGGGSDVSTSPKKRWKFVVLGLLFGFFGAHFAYAKRWFLFLLLWAAFITGGMMSGGKSESAKPGTDAVTAPVEQSADSPKTDDTKKEPGSPIGGIGFGVWALLWIGGTLFIKKDGKGNRM